MKLSIVKLVRQEYREGDLAVRDCLVTFLNIPVYRSKVQSTNNQAVRQLTAIKEKNINIKGFQK